MKRLKSFWSNLDSLMKVTWVTLWIIGAILVFLGLWGDNTGFWEGKSFSTNLISSMTGAAFGIPLALIFLQGLTARQTELLEMHSAKRLAHQVAQEIVQNSIELMPSGIEEVENVSENLAAMSSEIREIAKDRHDQEEASRIHQELSNIVTNWHQLCIIPGGTATEGLYEIEQQWSYFKQEVYARIVEIKGAWIEPSLQSNIDKSIAKLKQHGQFDENELHLLDIIDISALDDIAETTSNNLKRLAWDVSTIRDILRDVVQFNEYVTILQRSWDN
ncbi:hypothetical protein [Actinomadura rubrisoli]|uniref:Uncharacterized protein n=1 Tax=Actinomadura rubrisoli TaxID=2530368 RepID=A0A4R5CGC0_9ACTN|nr:hypothetical protein [Actinomadura rubrisoli]TDD98099.1 hypothetical protein E1298_00050 [Actinomadura rubrisoli]